MTEDYFEVETPLGFSVSYTQKQWDFIITEKHTVMAGQEEAVRETLRDPDEVRKSSKDERAFLFYKSRGNRYLCVVIKRTATTVLLSTTYPTDAIKIGEVIWTRSK